MWTIYMCDTSPCSFLAKNIFDVSRVHGRSTSSICVPSHFHNAFNMFGYKCLA